MAEDAISFFLFFFCGHACARNSEDLPKLQVQEGTRGTGYFIFVFRLSLNIARHVKAASSTAWANVCRRGGGEFLEGLSVIGAGSCHAQWCSEEEDT